ncbi:MAG TPA: DUF2516 family protein [Micromonosporaceae bacterium]
MASAPLFYLDVLFVVNLVILIFAVVVEGLSFVHALTQRKEAFTAIGTLPKGAWLAILGISLVLTLLFRNDVLNIFGLIGIAAALIYLLDVRVGLRDLTDGKGFW